MKTFAPIVVLSTIMGLLDKIEDQLLRAFGRVSRPKRKLRWGSHIPDLADTIADVMDLEPHLFRWVSFTACALRQLRADVLRLMQIKSLLEGLLGRVNDLLKVKQDDLYTCAAEVVDGTERVLKSPAGDRQERAHLDQVYTPVRDLVKKRNQKIGKVRRKNKKLAARKQAAQARLETETRILRGQLPEDAGPATPALPRSARR